MTKIMKIFALALLLSLFALKTYAATDDDKNIIICGHTSQNKPVNCDLRTHYCLKCDKGFLQRIGESAFRRLWGTLTLDSKHNIFYNEIELTTYTCKSKGNFNIPSGCEISNIGGESGQTRHSILGIPLWKTQGHECVMDNIKSMYTKSCYSCEIVETLASAFIKGAAKAYDVSREAANVVLTVGIMLWLAWFVLKNISSFTSVEPMKMLQDLFVQLFKVLVAFTIINSGIDTILHYTLEPLMLAGTDFSDAIIESTVEIDAKKSEKIAEALKEEAADNASFAQEGGK